MRLEGKVAIITGCAQGIGKATAEMFIKEGALLMINDLQEKIVDLEKELKEKGGDVISFVGNAADYDAVQEMVDKTLKHFGKIDILVNTVALPHRKTIMETPIEEFDRIINVNMKAVFYPTKAVLPHMIERRYGRIINVSSVAARRGGGMLGKSTYAASKAGVIGLTKGIAREVGPYGITVNTVAPGLTDTPRNSYVTEEQIERCLLNVPLKRVGLPEDMAPAIVYLASDEASFVSGLVLAVDGGYSMV